MGRRILSLILILALLRGLAAPARAQVNRTPADSPPGDYESDLLSARAYWYEHAQSELDLRCGIDVSEWQGVIDWAAAAESGVEFAFIRTSGRYLSSGAFFEDAQYPRNLKEARANGILTGAYIFSQATTPEEAREEARFLIGTVSGHRLDLPLVMDYEYSGTWSRLYRAGLGPEAATEVCLAFCDEAKKHGYDAMVYANRNMLFSHLLPEYLELIWLANYDYESFYTEDYPFWQFTSSGSVAGINGRVDLDFWFVPKDGYPVGKVVPENTGAGIYAALQ